MPAFPIPFVGEDEYLRIEREAETRSEYHQGQMYPLVGATVRHALISASLGRRVGNALENRPCSVYAGSAKVKITSTGLYTYPDWAVVCGQILYSDKHKDTILNPKVLFEVLSKSTAGHDRGFKFFHYSKIDSVDEYVLVSQGEPRVGVFRRQPNRVDWLWTEVTGMESKLALPSLEIEIPLAEIYDKVEFDSE